MEFAWIGNDYIRAIEAILSPGGLWYGDTVWFEGDYNDPDPEVNTEENLYHLAYNSWECVSVEPLDNHKRFVINATKQQYIDLEAEEQSLSNDDEESDSDSRFVIHPLPILLACSSEGGGGDYKGTNEDLVGLWVGDRVYTDDVIPEGYDKAKITFREC